MRLPFPLRWLGVGLLALSLIAAFAFTKGSEVKVDCVTAVHYSPTYSGIKHAETAGNVLRGLADGDVSPADTYRLVKGTLDTITLWWAVLRAAAIGDDKPELATKWEQQQEADAQAAVGACCPGVSAAPATPTAPEPDPFDSRQLSLTAGAQTTLTPEQTARQAAAAYWPSEEVPIAVAVAHAESGFNPRAHNDYGDGVEGLWQINIQAHRELVAGKNLQDPMVNAALAFQIWKDAGRSWSPWTTYTSGAYRQYLRPASSVGATSPVSAAVSGPNDDPSTVSGPQAGCSSGSMPGLKIVTWNSYCGRSYPSDCSADGPASGNGRVVDAMRSFAKVANVIAGQEFSSSSRRDAATAALPGWGVAGADTSHPIWFDQTVWTEVSSKATLVLRRHQDLAGPPQGARWVVQVTLADKTTGKQVTVVNTHQLPKIQEGGTLRKDWGSRIDAAVQLWTTALNAGRAGMTTGAAVIVGDMNYDGDPDGMYRKAGFTQASAVLGNFKQSHRERDIDQVLFSAGQPTSMVNLGAHGSDHDARLVTFADTTQAAAGATSGGVSPASFNFPGQNSVDQAIAFMQAQQTSRQWGGACLAVVGRAYGHSSTQMVAKHYYATGQWDAMPAIYKHTDGSTPPRGALIFWRTGSAAGHIAISAGGGQVWTSDPPGGPHGSVGLVTIDKLDAWGPRLGWSEPYFVGRTKAPRMGLAA